MDAFLAQITINSFKEEFFDYFIFQYNIDYVYNRNNKCYDSGKIYKSITFDNQDILTASTWEDITSDELLDIYISDNMIQKSIDKLKTLQDAVFRKVFLLNSTNPLKLRIYKLYVAHFLQQKINTTLGKSNINITNSGVVSSTSDGSNSISFAQSKFVNDPAFQELSGTEFGIELFLLASNIPNIVLAKAYSQEKNDFNIL